MKSVAKAEALPFCRNAMSEQASRWHLRESKLHTCLRSPKMRSAGTTRSLQRRTHGVNDGFYPLGSCTMKYNPRVNEEVATQVGFTAFILSRVKNILRDPWRS